jgi:Sec-independent protein translocase protein TatA
MIKSLLKLGLILVIAVIGYNYFFGTAEEKEQSREIIGKVRDVGRDAWGLLKSEKAKLDEGKYDGALDKVGTTLEGVGELLGKLKHTAEDLNDSGALDRLSELQRKQADLEAQLAAETPESYDAAEQARIKSELKELLMETETLMNDMEQ